MMPHTSHSFSLTTTLLLVLLLTLGLFPSLFHSIWTLPFYLTPFSRTRTGTEGASIMSWTQKHFTLPARSRGSYLITDHVLASVPEIKTYKVGLLNLFVQHTSCALSLNENCKKKRRGSGSCLVRRLSSPNLMANIFFLIVDDDVRADMSDALDRIAPAAGPKGEALYRHE